MHPQLELLLQIQDLKSQRRELADADNNQLEQLEFNVDIDQALSALDAKLEEVRGGLEPRIRARLDRIEGRRQRAVVPLINGTCYGCFTMVPTANLSAFSNRDQLHNCENCGRFLYSVEG
jgi:predicted  nucleic acid-binding Zn-ribbon protein